MVFSLKWVPMKVNNWLGCETQCMRTAVGTSTSIPTMIQVVASDPTLPFSYTVSLHDPSEYDNGLLCYSDEEVPPIRGRDVPQDDEQGVLFVLKDGQQVVEILLGGFCFYQVVTVSGNSETVFYVDDVFHNFKNKQMNLVVLGNYSSYTTRPNPGSIMYVIYDADECP